MNNADIIGEIHIMQAVGTVTENGKGVVLNKVTVDRDCHIRDVQVHLRRRRLLFLYKLFCRWVVWTVDRIDLDELPPGIEASDDAEEAADAPEEGNGMTGKGKGVARDDGKRTVLPDKRVITDNLDEPGARRTRFCLCVCWNALMEILGRGSTLSLRN